MARLTETAIVERPIEEVFAYLVDFSSTEEWDPGVRSARRLDAGEPGVGSRYRLQFGVGPTTFPLVYETVTSDPLTRIVHRTSGTVHRGVDDIQLEEVGEGRTRITWDAEFALRGPGRLVDPALRVGFGRAAKDAMEGLAAALDGRRTTDR